MLDLKKLLNMQKELDKTIFKNSDITKYPLEKVKLALLVELGELANEDKCFKYWKKHKEIDKERVLDEFADCLHFALSLENEFHQINYTIRDIEEAYSKSIKCVANEDEKTIEFLQTFELVINEDDYLLAVISIGVAIGITLNEIEQAYLAKNKVNYERQNNGY